MTKLTGHSVTYVHTWLFRTYGRANKCISPTCTKKFKVYNWALIHGKKYEKNLDNFMQLCISCHKKYDGTGSMEKRKLNADQIRQIRLLVSIEHVSQRKIAAMFNISQTTVGKILMGRTYVEIE